MASSRRKRQLAKEKHRTGKLKYGSVSALMLAMVLIALIALNAGIYALEKNKGWRIDLSFNWLTSCWLTGFPRTTRYRLKET